MTKTPQNNPDQVLTAVTTRRTCDECGSQKLVTDSDTGEIICTECGAVVVETLIDHGPEWRAFDLDRTLFGAYRRLREAVQKLWPGDQQPPALARRIGDRRFDRVRFRLLRRVICVLE